jgi:dipeptidyl aminopeptidase/acylaminoacyl peptidase
MSTTEKGQCEPGSLGTLEQFRHYAFPTGLTAAAQAPHIAWVASEQGRNNVWVAAAPQFQARQLTAFVEDDGQEISSLTLTADGAWAVFVRGGEHGGNWQREQPVNPLSRPQEGRVEIWSVPVAGGSPRCLATGDYPTICPNGRDVLFPQGEALWRVPIDGSAEARPLFSVRGSVGSPVWSPDGTRLAFVANRGTHSFIGIYSGENSPIRWIAPSTARDTTPRWSTDGKRIVFMRLPSDRPFSYPGPSRFWDARRMYLLAYEPQPWSIWVADAATGEARQWWASGKKLKDSTVEWWPYLDWAAGDRVVFMSYQDGWRHLYSLSGPGNPPLLLTPGSYSIDAVTLTADRTHIVFNANTGSDPDDVDRRHLFKVPVDRPALEALTSGASLEWSPVVISGGQLGFISATAQRPPQPAVAALDGGGTQLLAQGSGLAQYPVNRLVVLRKVTFKAKDGVTVHGQLFVPQSLNAAPGTHPGVVYIHGGPGPQQLLGWNPMDYYSNDYAVNQYLASRGFVVLAVNFRTDWSYGHEFHCASDAGPHGAADYQDIQAAGRFLQSRQEVDPSRIGVYGGSYGGYLTAMALAHDSSLFKAGVDIHGIHDWIEHYDLRNLFAQLAHDDPADAKRMLEIVWRSSPVSAVSTWKSPVLFISGDDDRNVGFDQTLDLVRRLDKAGVYHEGRVLPDETHSLLLYANVLKMNVATVEFLERFLLDASRP